MRDASLENQGKKRNEWKDNQNEDKEEDNDIKITRSKTTREEIRSNEKLNLKSILEVK